MSSYLVELKKKVAGGSPYRLSTPSSLIQDKPLNFLRKGCQKALPSRRCADMQAGCVVHEMDTQPINAVDTAGRHIVANDSTGLKAFENSFKNQKVGLLCSWALEW
jgi:hypothetical protein